MSTTIRLGYVAMSVNLKNSSPSQTMTFAQFQRLKNREAAIAKLERIAISNLENCLRLLKHNVWSEIEFFRLSSRIIPLANHEELTDWDYLSPLEEMLTKIRLFLKRHKMRIDFHPDHFVVLNSTDKGVFKHSIQTLSMHKKLLQGMGIPLKNRCVLHIGGAYNDKEKALEQFVQNWGLVPHSIQQMIMLENDDTTFHIEDTLYLCEKLNLPIVFDWHHHQANHEDVSWKGYWDRIVNTWKYEDLPLKMHISSPKSEQAFRAHADYIDVNEFYQFVKEIAGTVPQIDCMIEAKRKDDALFHLMNDLKRYNDIEFINNSSFIIK
ncbi:UV DNA damage repair endonuclease UvsE [Priestia megaterium]|nr:UV DNA damage repair endonuclease UvsE [Priestia megaterium]